MTIAKQIIIDDQKKTIHRLQDECTEKTNAIIALGEQLKRKEQELDKIKEIINYYHGRSCSKCKHYKTCNTIDDCVNTIIKEVSQIMEGDDEV